MKEKDNLVNFFGFTFAVLAVVIFILISSLIGCWPIKKPPVKPKPKPKPQPTSEIAISFHNQTYGTPYIEKSGDLVCLTFWHKSSQPEYKAIEVWKGFAASKPKLLWSDRWRDPREFNPGERGPCAFLGGEKNELALIRFEAGRYMLRILSSSGGSIRREVVLPSWIDITRGPQFIYPSNVSRNRGNHYSDVVVTWNDKVGGTVRIARCYRVSDLKLLWENRIEADYPPRHNPRWSTPEIKVIREWPERDAFWYGNVVGPEGNGSLGQPNFRNPSIECLRPDGGDLPNPHQWDSCLPSVCDSTVYPDLYASTGSQIYKFEWFGSWCKNPQLCYWEYRYKTVKGYGHSPILNLQPLNDKLFLASAYVNAGKYKAMVINKNTMNVVASFFEEKAKPFNRIEWDGKPGYEILGRKGVYDRNMKLIKKRKGNFSLGNLVIDDHYCFIRKREGKREIVFVARQWNLE